MEHNIVLIDYYEIVKVEDENIKDFVIQIEVIIYNNNSETYVTLEVDIIVIKVIGVDREIKSSIMVNNKIILDDNNIVIFYEVI